MKKIKKTIDKPLKVCYNKYRKKRKEVNAMTLTMLENKKFDLEMKDVWTVFDRMEYEELTRQINKLKNR